MNKACELIAHARQFLGVRFVHQGRTAQGLDCLGLLMLSAKKAGLYPGGSSIEALDIPHYGARPDAVLLKQTLDRYLQPINVAQLQKGDVVLLKIDGAAQHLALISDYPMAEELGMIHAYAPARRVIEHRYDAHWRDATYAAYSVRHTDFSDG